MTIRDQDYGCVVTTNTAWNTTAGNYYYDESSPNIGEWKYMPLCPSSWAPIKNNKKGDDNMRYLYEVILVNPEDDNFEIFEIVAKTETSALMQAYEMSDFAGNEELELEQVDFDKYLILSSPFLIIFIHFFYRWKISKRCWYITIVWYILPFIWIW